MPNLQAPGFALPAIFTLPSPAAPLIRASSVGATLSDFQLAGNPRAVRDQGETQCCVSCAFAGAMEIVHPDWPELAPLFHYFVTRFLNNGADAQGFLTLDAAKDTLINQGICRHVDHDVDQGSTYTVPMTSVQPSTQAFADGLTRVIEREGFAFKVQELSGPSWAANIRDALRQNRPVVIGFRLPQGYKDGSFLDDRFEWTSLQKAPATDLGHCVLINGYNDSRLALQVKDSQGSQRFDGGSWWMAYKVADGGVIQDAYSLIP
jgi:hypothetical protein